MSWAYLLLCGDGSYYAGWTADLDKRLAAHKAGKGAKYTRSHGPVRLVWAKQFPTQSEAMREEARLKTLTHAQKGALAAQGQAPGQAAVNGPAGEGLNGKLPLAPETGGAGEELREALAQVLARRPETLVLSLARPGIVYKKAALRPVPGGWQLERFTDTQAFHLNLSENELPALLAALLTSEFRELNARGGAGDARLHLSRREKVLLSFGKKVGASVSGAGAEASAAPPAHNRPKATLLPEGEAIPALVQMGIFTPDGRVVKSQADKYRQVNRYVELVDDLLRGKGIQTLNVVDFGCGKGALTFLLYHFLRNMRGIDAVVTGVDRKAAVMEHCNRAAQAAGYGQLHFVAGDIADYEPHPAPDMVVALHACDTATDEALAQAVGWGARFILAAPCCQHELNAQMQSGPLPILTRYGIVQERAAALMTDALRANLLAACGYKTQLLEFVDLSHTPKNLLLRAERANPSKAVRQKALAEARALIDAFSFSPALLRLLEEGRAL